MSQEELAANRTHQTGLEAQIRELQTGHGALEQQLAKRDQKLQQQEEALKELQKQQVRASGRSGGIGEVKAVMWSGSGLVNSAYSPNRVKPKRKWRRRGRRRRS